MVHAGFTRTVLRTYLKPPHLLSDLCDTYHRGTLDFKIPMREKLEARRGKKNLLEGSYARVSRIYCVILLQNLLQQEDKTSFNAFNL